jgi:hypothetical protein
MAEGDCPNVVPFKRMQAKDRERAEGKESVLKASCKLTKASAMESGHVSAYNFSPLSLFFIPVLPFTDPNFFNLSNSVKLH